MRKLTVAALCLIISIPDVTPAQAFPAINPPRIEAQQQIEQVQWRGHGRYRGGYYRGYHRRHRADLGWALGGLAVGTIIGSALAQPYYGRPYYGSPYGYYGSPYRHYGSPYRYSPYRYYGRYYGRPYRTYASPAYYGRGNHEAWCYARYRSYRAYDNTFQPYYGPRRQCIGPY